MKAGRPLRGGSAVRWAAVAALPLSLWGGAELGSARSDGDSLPAERSVELTLVFTAPEAPEARALEAWVPLPAVNSFQKAQFSGVRPDVPFQEVEEEKYGNKFLRLDLSDPALRNRRITVSWRVQRLLQRTRSAEPLEDPRRFLGPDRLVPTDGRIAEEARRVAGTQKEPKARLKSLFDHVVRTVRYDKSGKGWGRGDALYACDVRMGNCTDFHSLLIGEARALGLPARFLIGFPLPEDRHRGSIPGYHCWAEVYVEGEGWIPLDASEAHKRPERRDFYFGSLDPHRVHFTTGRDLELPGMRGEPLNYVVYPYLEADGKPISPAGVEVSFRNLAG